MSSQRAFVVVSIPYIINTVNFPYYNELNEIDDVLEFFCFWSANYRSLTHAGGIAYIFVEFLLAKL